MSERQIWLAAVAVGVLAIVISGAAGTTVAAPFFIAAIGLVIWAGWKGRSYGGDGGGWGDGGGDGGGGGD